MLATTGRDSDSVSDTASDHLPDGGDDGSTEESDTSSATRTGTALETDTNRVQATDTRSEPGTGTGSEVATFSTEGTSVDSDTQAGTGSDFATDDLDTATETDTDKEVICEVPSCVVFVDIDAQGSMTGASWSDAYPSVQEGINAADNLADPTCEVWVAEGTYYLFHSSASDTVQMVSGVSVYGGFSGVESTDCDRNNRIYREHASVLSGCRSADDCSNTAYRVNSVVNGASDSRLDGFVVEYGLTAYGAGLTNASVSNLVVANCLFRYNEATNYGGGIYNTVSDIGVENCVFLANEAANFGAGICNDGNSFSSISNTVFLRNISGSQGGGIANVNGGSAAVRNSAVIANSARNEGAGIYSSAASRTVEIENTIISDNRPSENSSQVTGSGVFNHNSVLIIEDSVFVGNNSGVIHGSALALRETGDADLRVSGTVFYRNRSTNGDAIYLDVQRGSLSFQNVTVWDNVGGIALVTGGTPALSVTSAILWQNSGNAISAPGGFSGLDVRYSDLSPQMEDTNISADPMLVGVRSDGSLSGRATCTFNEADYQTEIAVTNASWSPGELNRAFIVDDSRELWRTVVGNSEDTLYVWGDLMGGFGSDACSSLSLVDLHPRDGSPCIDAGSGVGAPASDIQGKPRRDVLLVPNAFDCDSVQDSCIEGVDMGAYEYYP